MTQAAGSIRRSSNQEHSKGLQGGEVKGINGVGKPWEGCKLHNMLDQAMSTNLYLFGGTDL